MTVPYTFANAVGSIDLAELDVNFAAVNAYVETAGTVTSNVQANINAVGILDSVSVAGNVVGGNFIGDAVGLSNIQGSNVSGIVASAEYAVTSTAANTATFATSATYADVANTVLSINGNAVIGQVANALIAGTVYINAQPNITSVGTLTSLSSSGNITTSGNITGAGNISIGNIVATGNISIGNIVATGNISGNYIIGDGSQLTNLPPGNYSNANVAAYLPTYSGNIGDTANTNITIGGSSSNVLTGGNLYVNSGYINTDSSTAHLFNVGTSILNIGSEANISLGNSSGLTTINGNLKLNNNTILSNNISANSYIFNSSHSVFIGAPSGNVIGLGNILAAAGVGGTIVSAVGNIMGGNVLTDGQVSAVGDIVGNNISSTTAFQLPVYANTTARDTAISTPVIGMLVVVGNTYQGYDGVAWGNISLS